MCVGGFMFSHMLSSSIYLQHNPLAFPLLRLRFKTAEEYPQAQVRMAFIIFNQARK